MSDEIKLFVFSAIVFAVGYGATYLFPLPFILLLLLSFYFTAYSWIFNKRLQKAYKDENKNKFTQVFVGLTGIKILSSLILLAVFLYLFKEDRLNIGVCVMGYYFFYTAFEVTLWRSKLR